MNCTTPKEKITIVKTNATYTILLNLFGWRCLILLYMFQEFNYTSSLYCVVRVENLRSLFFTFMSDIPLYITILTALSDNADYIILVCFNTWSLGFSLLIRILFSFSSVSTNPTLVTHKMITKYVLLEGFFAEI